MNSDKTIARIVGALFIITMIAGMINAYFISPIVLYGPLIQVFPNKNLAIIGALLVLVMSVGIVFIATVIFPVLKRHNETIAITYISIRTIECVFFSIGAIIPLLLITLSQEYIQAGAPNLSYFQTIGMLAVKVTDHSYQIGIIVLGIGSLLFCYVLYQSTLIPRLISVVGLIGYALALISGVLDIFGIIDTRSAGMIMYLPGTLFELILLPIWLIVKGFNASAIDFGSAKQI